MVVEHYDPTIPRQADIAFDPRAKLDGGAESGKAVFGDSRTMEPAMREPLWTRI